MEAVRDVRRLASARKRAAGILYGRLDGQTLRIIRARTVPGGADERTWASLAAEVPPGLTAAGLFAARDEVALSTIELDVLRRQFPAPWQVALVMTPMGRAGFFVREYDGTLDPEHCRREFDVAAPTDLIRRTPGQTALPKLARSRPAAVNGSLAASLGFSFGFSFGVRRSAAAWAIAGIVALAAGYGIGGIEADKRLQLGIEERGDRVMVSWDREAVLGASSGELEILDGTDRLVRNLGQSDLISGRLTYSRRTGDVSVRLRSNGLEEAIRYLGRAPETALPKEISALVRRSANLRVDSADGEARIRELRRSIDRLSARLGPRAL